VSENKYLIAFIQMGFNQSKERRQPVTEAEKQKMTEPWAVDKCPKQ
jgi:hypothetical protein